MFRGRSRPTGGSVGQRQWTQTRRRPTFSSSMWDKIKAQSGFRDDDVMLRIFIPTVKSHIRRQLLDTLKQLIFFLKNKVFTSRNGKELFIFNLRNV